jgi:sarcosine oxidase
MRPYDVAIVGLGAMGSAAAWHLARRGVRVVGLDRHCPPHSFGSTHGRSRILREAYFEHPLYVPLVQRAHALWRELEHEAGRALMDATGGLMIGPEDGTLVRGAEQSARLHRLPCARWSAAEVRERVPALGGVPDRVVALWEPHAAMLRPEAAVDAMLASARAHGAEIVCDTAVTGWRADGHDVVLATSARDYHASHVVLAAGPWIGQLLPRTRLPLAVERAVQFWFEPAADRAAHRPDRLPVFIVEWERGRLFYGLPDHGHGVKVAEHHAGEATSADHVRRTVGDDERTAIRGLALPWLPGLGRLAEASVCLYTNTPDGHFVIDRLPRHPNVVVASPCSGHGFKFAPAIGAIVADLVTGRIPTFDLSPFRLSRF